MFLLICLFLISPFITIHEKYRLCKLFHSCTYKMHYFTWSLLFFDKGAKERSFLRVVVQGSVWELKGLAPKVCSCCDQLCVRHVWPFSWAFLPALWCFAQHCGPLTVDSGSGNKGGLAFSLLPSLFVASATGVSHLILSGLCSECLRPSP